MDSTRYQILLAMLAVALAVVSARLLKAGSSRSAGYLGFLCVAIIVVTLLWSLMSG